MSPLHLLKKDFIDNINLQEDLNSILSFLVEICKVPCAFVSLIGTEGKIVKAEVGFNFLTIPEKILVLNDDVIQRNKITIVNTNSKEEESKTANPDYYSFNFFAGFPICTGENIVVGTLCIMDNKAKELSPLQLKLLNQSVLQIQSLLKLHIENYELKAEVLQGKNQLKQIINNSNVIFYEVSLDGIFTNASENWTQLLGHDLNKVIGKNISEFIHPEDIERCNSILKALSQGYQNREETLYRILHKDKYYVWHSTYIKFIDSDGIQFYTGNCRDITDSVKAHQKLLEQKEFYEKILDQLPIDIAVYDSNFKYIYLNPNSLRNEVLRKFIIGKDDFEFAKHTGSDEFLAKNRTLNVLKAIESRALIEWEETIQHQNGELRYHTRKLMPVCHKDGSLEIVVGFGMDITESKLNQEEIIKGKQFTKSIIQNVAVGVLVYGLQSEILESNLAASQMLGLPQDQLNGRSPGELNFKYNHLDGTEFLLENLPIMEAIKYLKPVKKVVVGVFRTITNDQVWLLVDAIPVVDDLGILLYVVCSFSDITALKSTEDALKSSVERFTYSSMATSDAIWDWDIITDEIFVAESYDILFGYQFENNIISGKESANFVHPEDRGAYLERMNQFINSNDFKLTTEYRFLKGDGTYAFVKDKAVVIRNEDGKAIRMIGATQDVTNEKKLEDKLLKSEDRFKGAFKHTPLGMAITSKEGFWIEVNNRLCEILGYSKEEFKTMKFDDLTYFEDLEKSLENNKKLSKGEISTFRMEKRYVHKNKSLVWAHLSVSAVRNKLGIIKHHIIQIIDITDRKKIEEKNKVLTDEISKNKTIQLDEAKNMYRLLADNTVDLVCLHNLDGSFTYISPSIHKLLGYLPEELIGKFPENFVHPEDIDSFKKNIVCFLEKKEALELQIRFRNKEGNYIWFETKAIIVKKNGLSVGFQSSTRDITQRIEAQKLIENTLIQERELNELRTNLVSTISHEFRTPMTTIRTSAELISMYLNGQNIKNSINIEKRLNSITEQIDRIVDLMNAVLTLSKEESGKTNFNPVTFDLKQLCLDVIDSSYVNLHEERSVQTTFEGGPFYIFADKNLIEYCIFNVLNNAFKYSKGLGDIIFRVFADHDSVYIEIIDFGIGIPEQDLSKLFNTFFRGSNTDGFQGSGLGLYIVKTFAEKNSGTIQIESKIGKGTKVTLKFPLKVE